MATKEKPICAETVALATRLFEEWVSPCFFALEKRGELTKKNCDMVVRTVTNKVLEFMTEPTSIMGS